MGQQQVRSAPQRGLLPQAEALLQGSRLRALGPGRGRERNHSSLRVPEGQCGVQESAGGWAEASRALWAYSWGGAGQGQSTKAVQTRQLHWLGPQLYPVSTSALPFENVSPVLRENQTNVFGLNPEGQREPQEESSATGNWDREGKASSSLFLRGLSFPRASEVLGVSEDGTAFLGGSGVTRTEA